MRLSMSTYHFDTEDANNYGVEAAIILYNLCFWIKHNKANDKHFHKGRYWTYNSTKAFTDLFPFWSYQKIGRLLRSLETDGVIVSDNFNKAGFDKTKWYSVLKSACLDSNAPLIKSEQPIPDSKPDSKLNNKKLSKKSFGEYQNVKLTDEQYCKLLDEYGETKLHDMIERMSSYIEIHGTKYKNFAAAIKNWFKRNNKQEDSLHNRNVNVDTTFTF